ncbi:hypothetical protein [Opitutus sp. GAS368]|uniref:anti-sigma factor family protein n=1 Tax=Opitutus sp. GAS368 TaxID=1882749 RepID=UPI00087C0DA1|nr:hypothetical protein [Opitutus sp. GAS368]SDS57274.1 hypothetical protein SAMN05444173_3295 [Opitutus sp. GAS368]
MKDQRFIELVNLYIDRQITVAETAELEAEIQTSPRRRAVYRQYCQLHSATKQVYDSFRTSAASPQPGLPAGRAVLTDFKPRSRSNWIHYAGGLTAAACLTVVLIRFNSNSRPATDTPVKAGSVPAVQVAAVAPAVPVVATPTVPTATPAAPGITSLRSNLNVEPDYAAMLAALRREEQRSFANGEIQNSRLPSLFDDGVFEARPFSPANNPRTFRSKQVPAQPAEFTAFEFRH